MAIGIGSTLQKTARAILCSVVLPVYAEDRTHLHFGHHVLRGSLQWGVGRNVTSRSEIFQGGKGCLRDASLSGLPFRLPLLDRGRHLYHPLSMFTSPVTSTMHADSIANPASNWPTTCCIVDRVHTQVCGHCSHEETKTVVQCTHHWSVDISEYLSKTVACCDSFLITARPKPSRKQSISILNRKLTKLLCVAPIFFEGVRLFHAIDADTSLCAGSVCPDVNLPYAIHALETI